MRITYAQIFYDQGVALIPVKTQSKHILAGYGPHRRQVTQFPLFAEFLINGGNYALCTGTGGKHQSGGLVVLDFDNPELFDAQAWNTFTVKTARGYHVYFWADDVRSFAFDGLDVLGIGKACMGAYSVHPSGAIYQPLNAPSIRSIESLRDFPLLSKLQPKVYLAPPKSASKSVSKNINTGGMVARIKSSLGILEAMRLYQPKAAKTITGAGRWRQYNCAFHDDNHRSGWLDTERNLFGCHACDKARGDVLNFVSLSRGITNLEAIKLLGGAL